MAFPSCEPWAQQNGFNTSQSGDLSSGPTTVSLSGTNSGVAYWPQIATIRDQAWWTAGNSFPINSSGYLGNNISAPYQYEPALNAYAKVLVVGSYVYTFGGVRDNGGPEYNPNVYRAAINQDGTLGNFSSTKSTQLSTSLLSGFVHGGRQSVFLHGTRIYFLGGGALLWPGTSTTVTTSNKAAYVNVSEINNGSLCYYRDGGTLSYAVALAAMVVTSARVYLIGGINSSGNTVGTVQSAPINQDGTLGTWRTDTGLNLPSSAVLSAATPVVTEDAFYLFGGFSSLDTTTNAIYYGSIDSNGEITSISRSSRSLSVARAFPGVVVTSSRVYLVQGTMVYADAVNNDHTSEYFPFSGGLNDYRGVSSIPISCTGVTEQEPKVASGDGISGNYVGIPEQEPPEASGVAINPIQCTGSIEQGLTDAAGYGAAYIYGSGVVAQELSEGSGVANVVFLANGSVEQTAPVSNGFIQQPNIGFGRVIQPLAVGNGYVLYPAFGWMMGDQTVPRAKGTAYTGNLVVSGVVVQEAPVTFGTASMPCIGFGAAEQPEPGVNATASMPCVGFGRTLQDEPVVIGFAAQAAIGFGDVEQSVPISSGSSLTYILCGGNAYQQAAESIGSGIYPNVGFGVVIQELSQSYGRSSRVVEHGPFEFLRCQGVPPVIQASGSLIPLSFGRCSQGSSGGSTPATLNPLRYSRCQ